MENKTKKCSKCNKIKSLDLFYKNSKRHDGVSVYCKECSNLYYKILYSKNVKEKACFFCKKIFYCKRNQKYCSSLCKRNSLKKEISGYKECLLCKKIFPYRNSLNVRSCNGVGSKKQKFCSKKCAIIFLNKSPEHIKKVSTKLKGRISPLKGKKLSFETIIKKRLNNLGPKSHFWRGGKTKLQIIIRQSFLYSQWRKKVFERDNYSCVFCGISNNKLEVDHIKPFSLILKENNIKTMDDAINCSELWDVSNGRTLCKECHKKTNTYSIGAIKLSTENT